jgi:hypothetical protein
MVIAWPVSVMGWVRGMATIGPVVVSTARVSMRWSAIMISVAMVPVSVAVPVRIPVIAMVVIAVTEAVVVRMAEMKSEREMG